MSFALILKKTELVSPAIRSTPVLKSRIADQVQRIEELRKLEEKGSSAPTHSEVQKK